MSVNGAVRRSTPARRNVHGVAQADRDHRRGGRLLAVLVEAEAGPGRVEVDDGRVGRVARGLASAAP